MLLAFHETAQKLTRPVVWTRITGHISRIRETSQEKCLCWSLSQQSQNYVIFGFKIEVIDFAKEHSRVPVGTSVLTHLQLSSCSWKPCHPISIKSENGCSGDPCIIRGWTSVWEKTHFSTSHVQEMCVEMTQRRSLERTPHVCGKRWMREYAGCK